MITWSCNCLLWNIVISNVKRYEYVQTNDYYQTELLETIWLLVLERNTWNHASVSKLFILNKNSWNHVNKWLQLNRNNYLRLILTGGLKELEPV